MKVPSAAFETGRDVLLRHTEHLGELSIPDSALVQDSGGVDVKRWADVFSVMGRFLNDSEIGEPVVGFVSVDVMHMLGGQQLATEVLLHDPAVLIDLFPVHANDPVTGGVQAIDVLGGDVALATAEHSHAFTLASIPREGVAA